MADKEVAESLSPGNGLNEDEVEVEQVSTEKTKFQRFKRNRKIAFAVAVVIAVLGIIFFITGIVLIAKSKSGEKKSMVTERDAASDVSDECAFSKEAKRAGRYM